MMDDEFEMPKRSRSPVYIGGALVLLVFSAGVAWSMMGGSNPAQALFGPKTWVASHDSALAKVDLVKVHEDLIPSWGIASANREFEGAEEAEKAGYAAISAAIEPDQNLSEIFEQIRELTTAPVENADELLSLVDAWSAYLDKQGAPYLLQGNVATTSAGSFLYLKSYEVQRDVWLKVGVERIRAREVSRMDRTNIMEQYLGATAPGQADATVVLDRLSEFAISTVWPLLATEELTPLGLKVVEEMRANLPAEHLAILTEYAPERVQMQQALDSLASRRECGSTFMIRSIPYSGLEERDIEGITRLARQVRNHRCPDITQEEAEILADTSKSFAGEPELGSAIRSLVAMLARNVAVHEARHVADDRAVNGLRETMDCLDCPDMSTMAVAELSAYLASLSWSPTPYTSFFQACDATDGQGGPHAMAMDLILDRLDTFCGEAPAELSKHAKALEVSLLGRSVAVEVDELSSAGGVK